MAFDSKQITTTDLEAPYPGSGIHNTAHVLHLRGRAEILRYQSLLVEFSTACGQLGAMDYLEFFLTSTDNIAKIPHLLLITRRPNTNPPSLQPDDLVGSVLIYEYKLLGLPTRLFNTSDFDGVRAVIAPADIRTQVCATICRYLMDHGAQLSVLTTETKPDASHPCIEQSFSGSDNFLWTTQARPVGATIVLHPNVDETLATMGKDTRRNLRRYRRKAETELQCVFDAEAKSALTREQFFELNKASTHPVSNSILAKRFETISTLSGSFCVGLKTPGGQWISLMGGRRHHGVSEIDWQINRDGLGKYSIGTVIRAFLIEHETEIGTSKLFFEGGTPHSMRYAFLPEHALDIVAQKRSIFVFLLRHATRWSSLKNNFLLQTLIDPALRWAPQSSSVMHIRETTTPPPIQTS